MSMRRTMAVGILSGLLASPLLAQARAPRVAVVLDQASVRFQPLVDLFQKEVSAFFRPGEITVLPPVAGNGTAAGVSAVLDRVMRDSSVQIVVTLGSIGSHLLSRQGPLPKPGIAAIVIDAAWQEIPQKDGVSGVRNLVYVDQSYPVGSTVTEFRKLVPFHRIAVLLDKDQLEAIPPLGTGSAALVKESGAEAVIVPAKSSADEVLAALPAGIDAVYLTPLGSMSEAELGRLLAGFNARKLPTLSYLTEPDIHAGALASYEPPENWLRRTRRVAVNLQRIIAGEDAGTLPVRLVSAPRLVLNVATARRIGFTPGRSLLTDAALIGLDSAGPADTLSLAGAMRIAVATNLDLEAARLEVESGAQNVRRARASLLPYVDSRLSQTFTRASTAEASFGQQPERIVEGGLSLSMPIYSDAAWAGYTSEQRLQEARRARNEEFKLDVVFDAARNYLQVLRATTLADVRRTNLYRTRSNLEVARLREGVGGTSRADIYRWQGEVANARRDVITAESQVRVATIALNRVLNRPLERQFAQEAVSLADPALLAQDSTVLTWLDQPERMVTLSAFLSTEAANYSPELAQADATIDAQRRQYTSAGRAFWLPSFSLQGGLSNVFSRGGAGSTPPSIPGVSTGPDMTWQLRLQASIPLFTGFERSAVRAQTGIDLEKLEVQRNSVRQGVDQRVRSAIEQASASYSAIALTRDASEAAGRNYELVSDAYSRGAASITALIDAQTAALNASEDAANAVHDFLLDLMRVERAMGGFGAIQSPEQRAAFLDRLRILKEQS